MHAPDNRAPHFLIEQHVLPKLSDDMRDIARFINEAESFLGDVRAARWLRFQREHAERGVHLLPDGTTLVDFFDESFDTLPEGRLSQVVRGSLLVTLYGFLGSNLGAVCTLIKHKERNSFDAVSRTGKDNELERVKKYTKDVLEAPTFFATETWRNIQTMRRIRNCLVHNGGSVRGWDADREAILSSPFVNHGLSFRGNEIILAPDVWTVAISTSSNLVEDFGRSILEWAGQHSDNIEPLPDQFPEFYLGPVVDVFYIPEPPVIPDP